MKKLFLFPLILLLLSGITETAIAQNRNHLIVQLMDEWKKPVPYATLHLVRSTDSASMGISMSNEQGICTFQISMLKDVHLEISSAGYAKQVLNLSYEHGSRQRDTITIVLKKQVASLSGVTVLAKKPFIEYKTDRITMNVQQNLTTAGLTVLELLERVPGLSVDKDGNIIMQGKTGVQVIIDGRATLMNTADLVKLLRSMPADQVASIESLHAPSAKYDATGNAGIILIKTKKRNATGMYGSLNIGAGYGNFAKANVDASLQYRKGKWGLIGQYGYMYNKKSKELGIDRTDRNSVVPVYFNQNSLGHEEASNHNMRVGIDYQASKRSSFYVNLSSAHQSLDQFTSANTGIGRPLPDSSLGSVSCGDQGIRHYSSGLSYKYAIPEKGREFTVDADYMHYRSDENMYYDNRFFDANGASYKPDRNFRSFAPSAIDIYSLKADYSMTFLKNIQLETGLKMTSVGSGNQINFEEKKSSNWESDLLRSNSFTYDEDVFAGYLNLSAKTGKWGYQGGFRIEHTKSSGFSPTLNREVNRNYTDIFPNLHISYRINSMHNISFSYNRRIQRPNYQNLNPFVYFIDQYAYSAGNAYLNPQYANNLSLTYLLKNKYMIQAAMIYTSDIMAQVLLPDSANRALFETHENLESEKIYRLTIHAPLAIKKWWNASISASGMYMGYEAGDLKGKALSTGQKFVMVQSTHQFNLGKGYNLEITGKYTSPLTYATMRVRPENFVDMGLSKKLMSGKGNLKIQVNDIFNIRKQHLNSLYPGFEYKLTQKLESRIARLSFSYAFGNNGGKTQSNRESGARPEMERLKL
ncbi:MAG TPA: hypothetical protein DHV17_09515 [Chitinophagaceae bacterium]|nr:hypothetical protein [Chitinophagaceae bacterium]HRF25777.1 TonB-dependent receptor [Ferruginibacter sp.]